MVKFRVLWSVIILCVWMVCLNLKSQVSIQYNNPHSSKNICIEYTLSFDDSLGRIRNHQCETLSLEQSISNYLDGLSQLHMEQCPEAFREAFHVHLKAWSEMIHVVKHYPALRGEMHHLFNTLERSPDSLEFKMRLANIWTTWSAVEASKK